MDSARRILTYGMALVGLFTTLYAASHMLSLLLARLLHNSRLPSNTGDVRRDLSLYLAALIVGLPLWLGAASMANRRARQTAEERDALERRLFLAFVFATTSLVAMFAARSLLSAVLTWAWAGAPSHWFDSSAAISAVSQIVVYGAAWLYHARVGWAERAPRDADQAHDLAVYVLAGSALACLVYGAYEAIWRIVNTLIGSEWLEAAGRIAWSDIAAWILAGGAVWGAVWRYDLLRGGRRRLRVVYLYVVLGIAVPIVLWGTFDGVYEMLRRLLGARAESDVLREVVPTLAIGGAVWAYHWYIVRAQAVFASDQPPGSIAWPRRPGVALLTLLGQAIAMPGAIALFWLGLDVLFDRGRPGNDWWRAQLSGSLAAVLVGGVAWIGAWLVLQHAASASPLVERTARARKLLLGAIVLGNALPATGFAIALLWLVLRALLGERLDIDALTDALKYLSAAAMLTATAVAHAMLLIADSRLTIPRAAMPRVRALVAAGAEEALVGLRRCSSQPIEVVGQLSALEELPGQMDLALLQRMIATLGTVEQEGCDSVLVLLRPDGGSLLRYTGTSAKRDTDGGFSGDSRQRPTDL
jgi:Domain of unknown function (DUF5671)